MLQGLIKFHQGLWIYPWPVKLWLVLLSGANMAGVFFLPRIEAVVTLVVLGSSMLLMSWIMARWGFTRLLGLGHILWIALVPWLWLQIAVEPVPSSFTLWLRVVITVNTISLLIDVLDVIRYARGERSETVQITP